MRLQLTAFVALGLLAATHIGDGAFVSAAPAPITTNNDAHTSLDDNAHDSQSSYNPDVSVRGMEASSSLFGY